MDPLLVKEILEPNGKVDPVVNAGLEVELDETVTPELIVIDADKGFT
jgi:hypothetical protein